MRYTNPDFNRRVLNLLRAADEPMTQRQIAKALNLSVYMADNCLTELRRRDHVHVACRHEKTNAQMYLYGKRPNLYRFPVKEVPIAPRDSVMCALMGIAA